MHLEVGEKRGENVEGEESSSHTLSCGLVKDFVSIKKAWPGAMNPRRRDVPSRTRENYQVHPLERKAQVRENPRGKEYQSSLSLR